MELQAVWFDLDGTLLPMDQDAFVRAYFSLLARWAAPRGYEPGKLADTVWQGTAAMIHNDGRRANEAVFWQAFVDAYGETALADRPFFDAFYREAFQRARTACGFAPQASQAVRLVRDKGFRAVLATNPVFPAAATESRIRWAGLSPEDFEAYTTYENASFCKPNLRYFEELAARLGLAPEACLMVGNDVEEDMVARELGMRVFLLTDCLRNRPGAISAPSPTAISTRSWRICAGCSAHGGTARGKKADVPLLPFA